MIKAEPKFCLKCVEKRYNLCARVLKEILRTNQEHSLLPCPDTDVKDGHWTPFRIIEKCKGIVQVGNSPHYTCGLSRTIERRECVRDLGGKYCKNDTDQDALDDISVRTVECNDTECPGETSNH